MERPPHVTLGSEWVCTLNFLAQTLPPHGAPYVLQIHTQKRKAKECRDSLGPACMHVGAYAGLRASGKKADLGLVFADHEAAVGGTFTQNVMCAAPCIYCKQVLSRRDKVRAVSAWLVSIQLHERPASVINVDGGLRAGEVVCDGCHSFGEGCCVPAAGWWQIKDVSFIFYGSCTRPPYPRP